MLLVSKKIFNMDKMEKYITWIHKQLTDYCFKS